jgi:hypothetical protein
VAVDRHNRIYFAPDWIYKVQQFSPTGRTLGYLRRDIQAKARTAIADGKRTLGWSMVSWDISIPQNRDRVYVLRARSRNGQSLIDVWSTDGLRRGELLLDHLAHSITCDQRGNLFLLYSNITESRAVLLKYAHARSGRHP